MKEGQKRTRSKFEYFRLHKSWENDSYLRPQALSLMSRESFETRGNMMLANIWVPKWTELRPKFIFDDLEDPSKHHCKGRSCSVEKQSRNWCIDFEHWAYSCDFCDSWNPRSLRTLNDYEVLNDVMAFLWYNLSSKGPWQCVFNIRNL